MFDLQAFRKDGPKSKRCYRNKQFTPVAAGCHHLQVLYAQYPGETKQGITFKIRQRHTWKYAAFSSRCMLPASYCEHKRPSDRACKNADSSRRYCST